MTLLNRDWFFFFKPKKKKKSIGYLERDRWAIVTSAKEKKKDKAKPSSPILLEAGPGTHTQKKKWFFFGVYALGGFWSARDILKTFSGWGEQGKIWAKPTGTVKPYTPFFGLESVIPWVPGQGKKKKKKRRKDLVRTRNAWKGVGKRI